MKTQINLETRDLYHFEDVELIKLWIERVILHYGFDYSEINYTFYSDEELRRINKAYLDHDFYTDIITFDNTINKTVSADIVISIDRIRDNSKARKIEFKEELKRVLIHGILHCLGFDDKSDEGKQNMRDEEDKMIELFHVEHLKTNENV